MLVVVPAISTCLHPLQGCPRRIDAPAAHCVTGLTPRALLAGFPNGRELREGQDCLKPSPHLKREGGRKGGKEGQGSRSYVKSSQAAAYSSSWRSRGQGRAVRG